MLTALATFTAYTQLGANIGHLSVTVTADVSNLLIGNLAANAYVHDFSSVGVSVNANENDCQQQ